jgi:hypothetical protein
MNAVLESLNHLCTHEKPQLFEELWGDIVEQKSAVPFTQGNSE